MSMALSNKGLYAMTFFTSPAEANPREGRISNESPLGRAIMEKRPGDVVEVEAPGGSFEVKIVKVE